MPNDAEWRELQYTKAGARRDLRKHGNATVDGLTFPTIRDLVKFLESVPGSWEFGRDNYFPGIIRKDGKYLGVRDFKYIIQKQTREHNAKVVGRCEACHQSIILEGDATHGAGVINVK